jgi:hypothetical protein
MSEILRNIASYLENQGYKEKTPSPEDGADMADNLIPNGAS